MSSLWSSPAGMANATVDAPLVHISGLTQVLLIALLAAPIWLFGLLIGLLLPKGFTESRAASVATESASSISSIDSDAAAYSAKGGPSSRPLSDDELAASSEADDEWEDADEAAPLSSAAAAAADSTASPAGGSTVRRTVAWAQQFLMLGASTKPQMQQQDAGVVKALQRPPSAAAAAAPAGPISPFAAISKPSSTAAGSTAPYLNGLHAAPLASGRHAPPPPTAAGPAGAAAGAGDGSLWPAGGDSHVWYVGLPDLARFSSTVEPVQERLLSGKLGQGWSTVMDKDVPGVVRYVSYMRPTDTGGTDYLSVTIVPNATAQEIHEFNLDDECRSRWDPMLKSTWLLGSRQLAAAEQLVVWLRSFPMGFLSDRLYAGIARRTIADPRQPHCLYGVSKVVHTPVTAAWAAENFPGVIQTDNYYSAWRCRTIPSPWETCHNSSDGLVPGSNGGGGGPLGGGQPACELVLLHHDELKVPESLARMAIKLGMWKFVQGMVDAAGGWLEERRSRVDPFTDDPAAACRRPAPALTGATAAAAAGAPAAPAAGPAATPRHRAGSGARIDALLGDADALVTPRRLVAVPTAPDLLSVAGIDSDEDLASTTPDVFSEPLTGAAAAGAAPVAAATPRAARLKVSGRRAGHRRASSMDWTPKPDDGSSSSSMQRLGRRRSAELRHPKAAAAPAAGNQDVLHVALPPISTARQDTPDLVQQQQGQPQQQAQQRGQQQQQQQQGPLHFVRGLVGLPAAAHGAVGSIGGRAGQLRGRTADALRWLGRHIQPTAADAAAATGAGAAAGAAGSDTSSQDASKGAHGSGRDQGDLAAGLQPVTSGQPAAAAAAAAAAQVGETNKGTLAQSKGSAAVSGAGLGRQRSSAGRAGGGRQAAVPKVFKALVRGVVVAAAVAIGAGLAGVAPGARGGAGDDPQPNAQRRKRRSTKVVGA
ncbi:hypothetical protein COO60DRAFT_1697600 [Scenedesmus sp. NREL 46B-D3]|nr:hypothetical protein COO60DRAFT_1697600 [Scenedesmus sp. NREL 46B-D3]